MNSNNLQFFNPYADIRRTKSWLPHWQQEGAVYFVTFRLADSVPKNLIEQWESERSTWLRFHPLPWNAQIELEYHQRFSSAIERWLDASHGSCLLRRADCARIIGDALQHFDSERYAQIAWVVMPNHVHLVLVQNAEWSLEKVLHSWKSFTARQINQLVGRSGNLWQRDYFDRLLRDETHLANCVRYVRRNPKKAGLPEGQYLSYESALAKSIE
jgi:REP element-mobilizing transposase RayT